MEPQQGQDAAADHPTRTGPGAKIRLRGLAVVLVCLSLLVIAALLEPRESGYGTHRLLGLPSCGFRARTGYPCPTCGLTTSVCASIRLRFSLAWKSHPFGIPIFIMLLSGAGIGTVELVRGSRILPALGPVKWTVAAVLFILAGWGLNIVIGLLDGTYPACR
jgi:hypothetical protein